MVLSATTSRINMLDGTQAEQKTVSASNMLAGSGNVAENTSSEEIKTSKKNELIKLCADNKIDLKALYGVEVDQLNDEALCEKLLEKVNVLVKLTNLCTQNNIDLKKLYGVEANQLGDENLCKNLLVKVEDFVKNPSKLQLLNKLTDECARLGKSAEEIFAYNLQTATDDEINKMADAIELAKKKLGENARPEDIAKEAKNFNIGLNGGFSKEYLSEHLDYLDNGESLDKKLQRFYPKYFRDPNDPNRMRTLKELDPETRKTVLEGYFNKYFEQRRAEKGEAYAMKLQMQDFAKILINTKDEDKEFMADAIKELMAENRLKGLFATEASFETLANKYKWNDSVTNAQKAAIVSKKDLNGNSLNKTDALKVYTEIGRNQTYEGRVNDINELTETIQEIEAIKARGGELTESQQNIEALKAVATEANIISNATSNVVKDRAQIEELAKLTDNSAIQILSRDEYVKVYKDANEYIENHQEVLTLPKEEFIGVMDRVTDGRFSQIANGDIANVVVPEPVNETLGFAVRYGVESLPYQELSETQQAVKATEEDTTPKFTVESDKKSINSAKRIVLSPINFYSYIKSTSVAEGFKYLGKNFADASQLLKTTYIMYLKNNKNNLYTILYGASGAAQDAAIDAGLVDNELADKLGLTSDKKLHVTNVMEQQKKA